MKDLIHEKICKSRGALDQWFAEKIKGLYLPFACSFDIRDSSYKIAPVDANIYPAGFNNICDVDKDNAPTLVRDYLKKVYRFPINTICILTEEHSQNPFYWSNVSSIKKMIEEAGCAVFLTFPRSLTSDIEVRTATNEPLKVQRSEVRSGLLYVEDQAIDLIVSNNDFSLSYEDFIQPLKTPINPPPGLGWHQRKKQQFFSEYNRLATDFCNIIELDPWHLTIETVEFPHFDLNDEDKKNHLIEAAEGLVKRLASQYERHNIKDKPYLFIKNSSGTYGLAVIEVREPRDILSWNYKSRKKMKASKGGRSVDEVILQEGIPTILTSDNSAAEPALYMLGDNLLGGFLRTHGEKGPTESLNSPGAVFKRLCVSDLHINLPGCPLENVYGWVARLGLLAIGAETAAKNIHYPEYSLS